METILQQTFNSTYAAPRRISIWTRFMTWCTNEQENRLTWLAIALAGHGCFLTPLALFTVAYTGNNVFLWPFVIGAMGLSLVTNLAALQTKITIPVFFFSVLLDIAVIIAAVATWA